MKIQIFPDDDLVSRAAAELIAETARAVIAERGKFVLAVSGGKNPWHMLGILAQEKLPWDSIHLLQVDERVAPACHPDRNWTHIQESFLSRAPIDKSHIHPMPVEEADLEAAAARYAAELKKIAGDPVTIDLVHLGLGPDGHTASLVPGDPVLTVTDADVGITGPYQNRRRMTLTYPVLNRARSILWLVTDGSKADALVKLVNSDPSIPAGRVKREHANLVADEASASKLEQEP